MSRKRTQLEGSGIERDFVHLPTKSSARLGYSFIPGGAGQHPRRLLVFLSGIDSPQTVWQGVLTRLVSLSKANGIELPPILVYDRFGTGTSDHDPSDSGKPPNEYHDALEATRDLRQLITEIASKYLGLTENSLHDLRITFCAHSIGCCIARFYADAYPGTVEALLLIDSAIAGTAAEKLVPDPDIPEEWENGRWMLPEGTTADECRDAVRRARKSPFSGHAMTTRERIRWDNMPQLLPHSDSPRLRGPKLGMPLVTVVVSDAEVTRLQMAGALRISEQLVESTWLRVGREYGLGLVNLQGKGGGKGPITAKGCGHDIHRDGPEIVAGELFELLITSSKMEQSRI